MSAPATRVRHPLAIDRIEEIRRRLDINGSVSVTLLAETLGVSRETVRRDLKLLARRGDVEIVHGGATRRRHSEPALAERSEEHAAAKLRIARAASALVSPGATVLIDFGLTTIPLARELAKAARLTVATNSLAVATLMARGGHLVHMMGGEIDSNDELAMSMETVEALSAYRFDIAFVGVGGLSAAAGLTEYTRIAALFRARLITAAEQAWLLVDGSKFDRETPFPVANLERVAGIVTDQRPPRDLAALLARRGQRIVIAR